MTEPALTAKMKIAVRIIEDRVDGYIAAGITPPKGYYVRQLRLMYDHCQSPLLPPED